jgi:hypothetical protein
MQIEPTVFPPYCGQDQQQRINVPAAIRYRQEREEGPWVMLPYASLYPQAAEAAVDYLPPPIYKTDLWSAMQLWPLPQAG